MNSFIQFILSHSAHAPWVLFLLTLLAGLNFPISVDILMILAAFLAATILPKMAIPLYLTMLIGCYLSAWISYWFGRKFLTKAVRFRWLRRFFPEARLRRIESFYQKHGGLTLLIGRFIPFGMRNGIFMTAGMTKMGFTRFILRDGLACGVWATTCFTAYYFLGSNYETLMRQVKILNFAIFFAFSVTVIAGLWYKKRKNQREHAKKSSR